MSQEDPLDNYVNMQQGSSYNKWIYLNIKHTCIITGNKIIVTFCKWNNKMYVFSVKWNIFI
jgi:hypothetical protein